jgi:shikimate 5-dehydrogenase
MASVWLNPTLSPVVLPSMQDTGITLQHAQQAMTACFLHTKKIFTIFGRTVKHSLSPEMHNTAYAVCGLPHIYDTMQSQDLSSVHKLLEDEGHGGLAISLPYKSAVLPFLDEVSPDAKNINAVNTIVLEHKYQPNGQRVTVRRGYNTDYIGIRDCIDKHLSPANAVRDGTTALIIGAGGMAHAAIYACYELGVRSMCIYNRTPENARKLAEYYHQWAQSKPGVNLRFDILHSPEDSWPEDLRPPTIVVSCIPTCQIGSESLVALQLSDHWFESRTGGVFVEVSHFLMMNMTMANRKYRSAMAPLELN